MVWFRTKKPAVSADELEAARAEREAANIKFRDTVQQGFDIAQMATYFAERRRQNGFGDDFQITLTRKEKHAS